MSDVFFDRMVGAAEQIDAAPNVKTGMKFTAAARRARDPKVSEITGQTFLPRKERGWVGRGEYNPGGEQKYGTPDHVLDAMDQERRREQWLKEALAYYQN